MEIIGAAEHNLKHINVFIPIGTLTVVTGVSGSGKSTLVNEILYKGMAEAVYGTPHRPGKFKALKGVEYIDKIINIDQSPIGRTPRSNPATYTGVFDAIRQLYSQTAEAKVRGYKAGRFSFNIKGGRCEACKGDGIIRIEMNFLPDVYVPCEVCHGARYNRETLEVKYKGKNISDVLNMTVDDACQFFENIPRIVNKLKTLQQVGLGYIRLGQPATTLSGGEAQRVKLATELSKRSTGRTLYILDEPTTGLHTADIHKLMDVLQMLVDGGDTVVVIEHNLDVIKTADYLIDLGPEGGAGGGTVVATGTPEEICQVPASYTGKFLKPVLERTKASWPARRENKPWLSAKPSGKRFVTCRPSPASIFGKMRRGKSFTSQSRQSAQPRDQLCPPRCQQGAESSGHGQPCCGLGNDSRRYGNGSPHPGKYAHQEIPSPLQHHAPRRQDLSLYQGHRPGRLPTHLHDPPRQPRRARYFGPFADSTAVHRVLKLMQRAYHIRSCRTMPTDRPCLQYHLHHCDAPASTISPKGITGS